MKTTKSYDLYRYVDSRVEWKSNNLTKIGKILSVNKSRENIENNPIFKTLEVDFKNTRISQKYSQNDRFLIVVERFDLRGKPLLPFYYCTSVRVIAKAMNWNLASNTL